MKVNLSVVERLTLGNLLPKEGNFATLKVVESTQDLIGFTEEEHAILQFKHAGEKYLIEDKDGNPVLDEDGKPLMGMVPPGSLRWQNKIGEKEFDIGVKATDIIVGILEKMNTDKKLKMEHKTLYQKFVSPE